MKRTSKLSSDICINENDLHIISNTSDGTYASSVVRKTSVRVTIRHSLNDVTLEGCLVADANKKEDGKQFMY